MAIEPSVLERTPPETGHPNPTHVGTYGKCVPRDRIWNPEDWHSPCGSAWICSEDDFQDLKYYSQLGLKTFWWGAIDSVEKHNRYLHSIGTMHVAKRWHEKFFESNEWV